MSIPQKKFRVDRHETFLYRPRLTQTKFKGSCFLTQGLNPGFHLLSCRRILYCLSYQGSPRSGDEGIQGNVKDYLGLDLREWEVSWKAWVSSRAGWSQSRGWYPDPEFSRWGGVHTECWSSLDHYGWS